VFQGKFETADSITGEVEFSPLVGDLPSKHARSATSLGIVASSRSHGGKTDRPAARDDAVVEAADIRHKAASPTR
jgi:hypothetical protein